MTADAFQKTKTRLGGDNELPQAQEVFQKRLVGLSVIFAFVLCPANSSNTSLGTRRTDWILGWLGFLHDLVPSFKPKLRLGDLSLRKTKRPVPDGRGLKGDGGRAWGKSRLLAALGMHLKPVLSIFLLNDLRPIVVQASRLPDRGSFLPSPEGHRFPNFFWGRCGPSRAGAGRGSPTATCHNPHTHGPTLRGQARRKNHGFLGAQAA